MPPRNPSESTEAVKGDTYTWQQVAQHNTAKSAWIIVGDNVYDVTDWIERHPGGRESLLLAAGRDCTDIMPSYHPFTDKPEAILKSFLIGKVTGPREFPTYAPDTGFYRTIRERVNAYFEENNIDSKAVWPGLWRMALVFALAGVSFAVMNGMLLPESHFLIRFAAACVFGICQALPLLHVMHDASHTAIGHTEAWWKAVGRFCLDWYAGASMLSWQHQHTIGHHVYTNIMGVDPDMPAVQKGDLRRIVSQQLWTSVYKFQHLYLPVLYGLLGLKFRLQDITGTYWTKTNGAIRVNYFDSAFERLVVVKTVWILWRFVLPLYYFPCANFWILNIVAELMTGYWLAFNFQVSHISTVADYPNDKTTSEEIQDEWAVSQVKTSVDYAHGAWLPTFLSGALNYQTVHHLLPCVSQYLYPEITPIVLQVCKEYNVPFRHFDTFGEAFSAHWAHLYDMGQKGKAVHMD